MPRSLKKGPYIEPKLLKKVMTFDAASPVASSQVLISLIAFILVYSLLGAVGFYLIVKNAKKGPEPASD